MYLIRVDRSSAEVEKKVKKKRKPQEKWVFKQIDLFAYQIICVRLMEVGENTKRKRWICQLQRLELLHGLTRS